MSGLSPTTDLILTSEEQPLPDSQSMMASARRFTLLLALLLDIVPVVFVLELAFLPFFSEVGLDDDDIMVVSVTAVSEEAAEEEVVVVVLSVVAATVAAVLGKGKKASSSS